MKKSNKILIAFAIALILIPLMGMIYVSQVNYKTGTEDEQNSANRNHEDRFTIPSENMTSKTLLPFTKVSINDAKGMSAYIKFIKSDKFGVKVEDDVKDSIDFTVDGSGQLQINVKSKSTNRSSMYSKILIYGPTIKEFNLANAKAIWIDANTDSLFINAKNTASISLDRNVKLNSLRISTDQVKEVGASDINFKSLTLNLIGTNFNSDRSSYDQLSITAAGKSEIEINGSDNGQNYFIKNLFINTLNEADFKLENIKVDQCSGSFSDQTKVQMPAANLKQMFKK